MTPGLAHGSRRHRGRESAAARGFDATPGALAVVCGLHGGAGTTATTTALAVAAAGRSPRGGVLAVEAAATGELARRLGIGSRWSLARLATLAAAGSRPDEAPFAERPDGLRVLAAAQPEPLAADGPAVVAVLDEARRAHGLVVCDTGPAQAAPAAHCLAAADLVLWVARAERLDATVARLTGALARPARGAPWGLVVYGGRPSRGTLAAVRDDLRARVVLSETPGRGREPGAVLVALVRRLLT